MSPSATEASIQYLLGQAGQRMRYHDANSADAVLQQVLALAPQHIEALQQRGHALDALGRPLEAARCQCQAYVLQDARHQPPRMRGIAYYVLGEYAQAAEVYRQWVQQEPDNPTAQHFLAAFGGADVPRRASDGFVSAVFDAYAQRFDEALRRLGYQIPEAMGALLERHAAPAGRWRVLDGGCGTGLLGPVLRRWARHLHGVDLSAAMLARARDAACYDALEQAELGAFLQRADAPYDLIAFADTLIYFGDLAPVLAASAARLAPGGWLLFNTEQCADGGPVTPMTPTTPDFLLAPSGRYQHRPAAVQRWLQACGLRLEHAQTVEVRQELGQAVTGQLLLARKAPAGLDGLVEQK